MYKVDVTPVVGLPQFGGWSQIVSSYQTSNQLVCAFSIEGDHAGNVGRDLTGYISKAEVNSTNELHQLISYLSSQAEKMDAKLQLACGSFSKNKIYLGTLGGSVFLKRGDRTGTLLSSQAQIKIVEGKRVAEDVVVLVTDQATSFLAEIGQKFTSGFDTDSVVTSIIPCLHGWDDSSLASIAFVTGGKRMEVQTERIFSGETGELKVKESGELAELGQTRLDQKVNPARQVLVKMGGLLMIIFTWLKNINWRPMLAKLIKIAARVKRTAIKIWARLVMVVKRLISQDVYLESNSKKQLLRKAVPVGLGILVIGSLWGGQLIKVRRQVKAAETSLAPILEQLATAENQVSFEPILARESVSQAVTSLEQLEHDFADQKRALKLVSAELATARALDERISGQEELNQLEIFYDLRLVDAEFVATVVDATQDRAVFLDADRKKIISLNLTNKQATQSEIGGLENLVDLELSGEVITLLADGVQQQAATESSKFVEIIPGGDSNKTGTLVESFATYVYVFNPQKRNVYRYSQQADGYSEPIGWVSGAVSFDYERVASWVIDGDVWVSTRDGSVHKLASGREQEFEITGLEQEFKETLQVFTSDELENLYILEPDSKRLVVLTKEGEFIKEIKSDSLAATTMLFVSEKLQKAFGVSGSIVYSMSI